MSCSSKPHECQAIGNWVELPQTDASSSGRTSAILGMAKHYAHDKTSSAAFVKQQVLTSLHQAMLKSGRPAQCSWHDVRLHVPPRGAILQHLQQSQAGQCQEVARPSADDEQVSDSSSSASSASDEDCEKAAAELPWFQQAATAKKHLVQSQQGSQFIPWCRDSIFGALHVQRGVGLEDTDEICQKCLG